MPDNPKPKPSHGGKRPGAGAPKGNLNALKHGYRSQQFARIGALLAADPEVRGLVFHLAAEAAWRDGDADLSMDFAFRATNPLLGAPDLPITYPVSPELNDVQSILEDLDSPQTGQFRT